MDNPVNNVDKSRFGQGLRPGRAAARQTLALLVAHYPEAHCALQHRSAFELLVATILSAQCTDVRVNQVTPALFARFPEPAALAAAAPAEVESLIRPTGFFRNKAANLLGCARALVEQHAGEVPQRMAELVKLPGVGRKTANVVLNCAFGEETMAVDTHIFRVANRTGLAPGKTPLDVELGLLARVPAAYRVDAHHWLILHGRYVCQARKPLCASCGVSRWCDSAPAASH